MSWNKEAYWYDWEKPQKKGNRKKEELQDAKNKGKKQVFLMGYDGKAVDVEDSAGASWQSSSSNVQEVNMQTENRRLKEAVRFMLGKIAPTDEEKASIPDDVKELVRIDPRESIRLRQKELNEERKKINKLDKAKDTMEKKSTSFQSWKETIESGIRKEEKRHSNELAEISAEIKSLERQRDGVDPIHVDSEDEEVGDEVGLRKENRRLQEEVTGLRSDMQTVMAYTMQQEQKNAQMMEQLQAQMMGLVSALQGSVLTTPPPATSPTQDVKIRKKTLGMALQEEKAEGKAMTKVKEECRERSRTPEAERRAVKQPKITQDFESQQLKTELARYPEECQMAVLQTIQQDPEAYVSWEAVSNMIIATHNRMLQACVEVPMDKSAEAPPGLLLPSEHLPISAHPVMQPFGKSLTKSKKMGEGPYSPSALSRLPAARTPDGGSLPAMERMS